MPSGGARRRAKLRAGGVRAAEAPSRGNRAARRAREQAERRDRGAPRKAAAPRPPSRPAPAAPASRVPIEGPVRILFLDVDGTLTDGIIAFDARGDIRNFWVRDGLALEWARGLGVLPVVISGRNSLAVEQRMKDLGLEHYLGIKDKVEVAERVLAREGATWAQCVMVGDDLPDVAMLKRAGWAVAVADSSREVLAAADYVTRQRAGHGAVREVVEIVLRHNGVWGEILRRYEVEP